MVRKPFGMILVDGQNISRCISHTNGVALSYQAVGDGLE
jgi:hypothetical protein